MPGTGGTGRPTTVVTARHETFVFDIRSAVRLWIGEAARRGEVLGHDADLSVQRIDGHKAVDAGLDVIKLLTGTVKDALELGKIADKLVRDFGRWWHVPVYYKAGAKGDLVIFKGWPNGRAVITAARYAVTNVKMMEMQVGKPGIAAAAKSSIRFGIYLVIAVDFVQFVRDHDFVHFAAALTVDVPSVIIASAVGTAMGSLVAGTGLVVGTVAMGPALVAFGVAALVGVGLLYLDKRFHLTDKVQEYYEERLHSLEQWWAKMGDKAERHWYDFVNSNFMNDFYDEFTGNYRRRIYSPNSSYAESRGWNF
jgi:hypothetical protein